MNRPWGAILLDLLVYLLVLWLSTDPRPMATVYFYAHRALRAATGALGGAALAAEAAYYREVQP